MSKAKLKKYLQTLSKEQVIEVMLELYDARKEAKEYLEFYLTPNSNAELEKCKKVLTSSLKKSQFYKLLIINYL